MQEQLPGNAVTKQSPSGADIFIQIPPLLIKTFDETNLHLPGPRLQLFFPHNGLVHILEAFMVNKPGQVVSRAESSDDLVLVLPYTFGKAACNSNVEGAIGSVGE